MLINFIMKKNTKNCYQFFLQNILYKHFSHKKIIKNSYEFYNFIRNNYLKKLSTN